MSPSLFNIFIDELLIKLSKANTGVRIGDHKFNSFAYADDVTVFSSTATGLQELILICADYANEWRFRYGIIKSKCMVVGKCTLKYDTQWFLNGNQLHVVDHLDILGVSFASNLKVDVHIDNRISSSRKSVFRYASAGMSYPGLAPDVKVDLWKKVGLPSLIYGMDSLNVNKSGLKRIETAQCNIIKQVLGLRKRSHNTKLLEAIRLSSVSDHVKQRSIGLLRKFFTTNSPYRKLGLYHLSKFIVSGSVYAGSIINRIIEYGVSPIKIWKSVTMGEEPFYLGSRPTSHTNLLPHGQDGMVDSLRYLLSSQNYNKPGSAEHKLANLLVSAF